MYLLAQTIDPGNTIKALSDAGVTGLLLVVVIAMFLGAALAWVALRNQGKKADTDATLVTQLTSAITTLTTNNTTMTNAMQEMQTGARKRDLQFDKMNDIQEQQNKATTEQNKRLEEQTSILKALKDETNSLRPYVRDLTDATIGGTKDMSEAVQGLDKRIEEKNQTIIGKLDAIHSDVKGVPQGVIDLIDWDMVSDRIKQAVGPIVGDALRDCLKLTEEQAKELDDTQEKIDAAKRAGLVTTGSNGDDDPPPPDHKAPLPSDEKPIALLPPEQLKDAA